MAPLDRGGVVTREAVGKARDPLAAALQHQDDANRARARLRNAVRSLAGLGMEAITDAIYRVLDPYEDLLYNTMQFFEEAVAQRDDKLAEANRRLEARSGTIEELRALLRTAVLDADRRARRSGRPLPDWAREAAAWVGDLRLGDDGRVHVDEEPF